MCGEAVWKPNGHKSNDRGESKDIFYSSQSTWTFFFFSAERMKLQENVWNRLSYREFTCLYSKYEAKESIKRMEIVSEPL